MSTPALTMPENGSAGQQTTSPCVVVPWLFVVELRRCKLRPSRKALRTMRRSVEDGEAHRSVEGGAREGRYGTEREGASQRWTMMDGAPVSSGSPQMSTDS